MNYYTIIEPLVREKYWSTQYTEGMKREIGQAKGKYVEISPEDLGEVKRISEKNGTRPVAIVNCISKNWISKCLETMEQVGVHPLLLAPADFDRAGTFSSVTFDFYGAFYNMCNYLAKADHGKIALFGLNPSSANDVEKKAAFARYCESNGINEEDHIFWNHGVLEECCEDFFKNIDDYNSVICTNDVVAIILIRYLKQRGVSVPEDLYVAAMGNTALSELISPKITVINFDANVIGQQAARLYRFISRNTEISCFNAHVSGQIIARESTGEVLPSATPTELNVKMDSINFYEDKDVQNILALEELFQKSDELDRDILNGLLRAQTYRVLAESLHASESTIKYRVRKMIKVLGCRSKKELLELLELYLEF